MHITARHPMGKICAAGWNRSRQDNNIYFQIPNNNYISQITLFIKKVTNKLDEILISDSTLIYEIIGFVTQFAGTFTICYKNWDIGSFGHFSGPIIFANNYYCLRVAKNIMTYMEVIIKKNYLSLLTKMACSEGSQTLEITNEQNPPRTDWLNTHTLSSVVICNV